MADIAHWLHIYLKPKIGTTFISRKQAFHYSHRISAMGWFDTASCDVAATQVEAEGIFENWIGARVAVYVDNPCEPIWEGLINRVTFDAGGVTFTRSLDQMFNRGAVTYTDPGTTSTQQTARVNNTTSQGIYGIKEGSLDGFLQRGTAANVLGQMQKLRDTYLAFLAYPPSSLAQGGGDNVVHLEMVGMYHTLEWENYIDASVTDRTAQAQVQRVIGAVANGTTFFNNADTSLINANTSFNKRDIAADGGTVWQFLQTIAECGDGTNRWIIGINPTDYNKGTRIFYYRQFNTTVEYQARVSEGLRIRNLYGALIPPWTIKPDRAIRINDVLVGWNALGDDPRQFYIDNVTYEGDSLTATLQGADDVTTEGIFQFRSYYRMHNKRFGATPRSYFS